MLKSASRPEQLGCLATIATSFDVVAAVLSANPAIESMHFVTYHESPNWRDIAKLERDNELLLSVKGLQQDTGKRRHRNFDKNEISSEKLQTFAQNLASDELLGVASDVRLRGGTVGHIPMMDFICPPSVQNSTILARLLRVIQQCRGFLLQSGRSYHYYGVQILGEKEWHVFLGRCLLMSGFVDDRYIGHQLVDGHCVLRLSAGRLRPNIPNVVVEL